MPACEAFRLAIDTVICLSVKHGQGAVIQPESRVGNPLGKIACKV